LNKGIRVKERLLAASYQRRRGLYASVAAYFLPLLGERVASGTGWVLKSYYLGSSQQSHVSIWSDVTVRMDSACRSRQPERAPHSRHATHFWLEASTSMIIRPPLFIYFIGTHDIGKRFYIQELIPPPSLHTAHMGLPTSNSYSTYSIGSVKGVWPV
jgi:hypothetical protein